MAGTIIKYKISDDTSSLPGENPSDDYLDIGSFNVNKEWYACCVRLCISGFFALLSLMDFLLRFQKRLVSQEKFIRARNFHYMPSASEIQFEQHLHFYLTHFSGVKSSSKFQKTDKINSSERGYGGFR